MSTKTILTLEQFERLPDDDMQHELDEGELVIMPPPKPIHGLLQAKIAHLIREYVEKHSLGKVFTEVGFVLKRQPWTVRAPDVSFLRASRAERIEPREYIPGAPDLAIEVVSDSDTARQIMRKVSQYLRAGGRIVWVIYPDLQQVHVYESGGATRVLQPHQSLEVPDLLAGFSLGIQELFTDLL